MSFGRLGSMMDSLGMVPVSQVSVMRRFLMMAYFMVFGGFLVVSGRVLMMLGGLGVVVRSFFRHEQFPFVCGVSQSGP